ncbi:hypothetical protein MPSEU_000613100 [Mayamaea pseudoterrestris]|nr:hypothetical protein MPSEU_000613100 [Mayamaea pseudoterrestris]
MKAVRNRQKVLSAQDRVGGTNAYDEVQHTNNHEDTSKHRRSLSTRSSLRSLSFLMLSCLGFCATLTTLFGQTTSNSMRRTLIMRLPFSNSDAIIPSKPNTTLALLNPPGFLGGYRNQVIRLMGWVSYAVEHDYSYLYLPSILWRTQMQQLPDDPWHSIPMDLIFDVDYWNEFSFAQALPMLVREIRGSDCWTTELEPSIASKWESLHPLQHASMLKGSLRSIMNTTQNAIANSSLFNPRRVDLLSQVQHCQHPVVYGGGKGAGRLWNDYLAYRSNKTANSRLPNDVDQYILRALRPAERWRKLADECVAAQHGDEYLALHARVEVEMMAHTCGSEMNWNLTSIFEQVSDFLSKKGSDEDIGGVFVAVSRDGMQANVTGGPWQKYRTYAEENVNILNRLVGSSGRQGEGLLGGKLTVFECGKQMMDQFYAEHPDELYYGSLLEQAINFYIATAAKVFIGVNHSSYSTDVWTTRYYQGRGSANFQYTRNGRIEPVENGGLPTPHGNCVKKKRKQQAGPTLSRVKKTQ